jgi:predicted nucleic acid-binding protein
MRTAIDTSVLIAIAKAEPEAEAWVETLAAADADGELVICDVVAAEFFAVLLDEKRFAECLQAFGIVFDPISLQSAQLAGRIFKEYRS